jgi:hypothetical protein
MATKKQVSESLNGVSPYSFRKIYPFDRESSQIVKSFRILFQYLRDHDGMITKTKKSAIQHVTELTLLDDNLQMLGIRIL